jgi:hypothetical protein
MKLINMKFDNKIKMSIILSMFIILFLTFISGCINPMKQVPVMKINITFAEKEGIVETVAHSFTQGNVSYIDRPRKTQADSFPAILGRETLVKNNTGDHTNPGGTIIGPWETLPYKGSSSYSFNIGFNEGNYPESGDTVHISIIVVDNTGQRIGYFIEDTIWE